jgi:hypothetical protein
MRATKAELLADLAMSRSRLDRHKADLDRILALMDREKEVIKSIKLAITKRDAETKQ